MCNCTENHLTTSSGRLRNIVSDNHEYLLYKGANHPFSASSTTNNFLNSRSDGNRVSLPNNYAQSVDLFNPIIKGDSMLNYAESIRAGTLTFSDLGKFFSLYTKYNLEYPDLNGYSDAIQSRVIASTFRKIGVVQTDLPYTRLYEFANKYTSRQGTTYSDTLKKYVKDDLITNAQAEYIEKMIRIFISNNDFDQANNVSVTNGLNNLAIAIKADLSLTQKEVTVLLNTMAVMENFEYPVAKKTTTVTIVNDATPINCKDCLWEHRHAITAEILAALALLTVAVVGLSIVIGGITIGTGGAALLALGEVIGLAGVGIASAATVAQYCSYGVYKKYCGEFCAQHREGVIECDVCPWYSMFFDGANCYLGWYHSKNMGWVYGDAFWYKGNTSLGCSDGNLNSSWGYVPFGAGGHGVDSGGGSCLFGYNYDTSYIPWVSSDGFYLKPHCKITY